MGKKEHWQRWDQVFKEFGLAFSEPLVRWLARTDDFLIVGSNSPARRVRERRPDLVIDLREGERERRLVIECDLSPQSSEELIRRATLTQALFSSECCEPEHVVLNLTGGSVAEEYIEQKVLIRRINVGCMEAPRDIEKAPLGVLPFVGLMKNTSVDLVEGAARRSKLETGPHGELLTSTILDFAELGQGMEFTMAVQQRLRAGRMFFESLRADLRADLRAEIEAEVEAEVEAKVEAKVKAEVEAKVTAAREEGVEQLRQILRQQIVRKFPGHKPATIDRRLKSLDLQVLKALSLKLFDELSWEGFWKSARAN